MERSKVMGYAPVNSLKMYYEIHGEGDIPLVLIHGGGSTIETTFGNILPLLSEQGKLITVELQAHGRTNDRNAPESFEQDADDVAALLKYLKIEKANFLGFSNGGSTTMQIAIRHSGMVNKIVVISGVYKREGLIPGFFDGMQNATIADMPESLKIAYLKVVPNKDNLQAMFEKDKERMLNFKDWPDDALRSINAPTLLISADHDVIMAEHTVKMSRLISGARLAILPANHGAIIGEAGSETTSHMITAVLIKEFLNE